MVVLRQEIPWPTVTYIVGRQFPISLKGLCRVPSPRAVSYAAHLPATKRDLILSKAAGVIDFVRWCFQINYMIVVHWCIYYYYCGNNELYN